MADIVIFIVKTEVLLLNHYLVSKGRHHIKEVFQGFGLVVPLHKLNITDHAVKTQHAYK